MTGCDLDDMIRRATAVLVAEGATAVYIFGSFASRRPRPESDLDLAVVGLPEERYFRALAMVWKAVQRPVDLVDLDEGTPFTRMLLESGKLQRVA